MDLEKCWSVRGALEPHNGEMMKWVAKWIESDIEIQGRSKADVANYLTQNGVQVEVEVEKVGRSRL